MFHLTPIEVGVASFSLSHRICSDSVFRRKKRGQPRPPSNPSSKAPPIPGSSCRRTFRYVLCDSSFNCHALIHRFVWNLKADLEARVDKPSFSFSLSCLNPDLFDTKASPMNPLKWWSLALVDQPRLLVAGAGAPFLLQRCTHNYSTVLFVMNNSAPVRWIIMRASAEQDLEAHFHPQDTHPERYLAEVNAFVSPSTLHSWGVDTFTCIQAENEFLYVPCASSSQHRPLTLNCLQHHSTRLLVLWSQRKEHRCCHAAHLHTT